MIVTELLDGLFSPVESTPLVVTKFASVVVNERCDESVTVVPPSTSVTAPLVHPVPLVKAVHFDWHDAEVIPVTFSPAGTPIV